MVYERSPHKVLDGKTKKPQTMKEEDWDEMDAKAASAIHLNLGDEVIHNILEEEMAEAIWKIRKSLCEK